MLQGDEWTQEIVTNFYSGEIEKVIYRNYDNAYTKNKLEDKWVYTANDGRWSANPPNLFLFITFPPLGLLVLILYYILREFPTFFLKIA